jgi:hypothetical protein
MSIFFRTRQSQGAKDKERSDAVPRSGSIATKFREAEGGGEGETRSGATKFREAEAGGDGARGRQGEGVRREE